MKLYRYLIVLILISVVFSTKLRHGSSDRHHKKQDWSKETVGSHSPQVGVMEPTEGQLTTNWNELVNDHSKKMISLGMPEHIDMNEHVALGNTYEDVVYVQTDKQENPKQVIAEHRLNKKSQVESEKVESKSEKKVESKKSEKKVESKSEKKVESKKSKAKTQNQGLKETVTPADHSLEDLVAIEFDRDETDAPTAFNNLMRHQDQILDFLSEIEHVEYLSDHQQVVVNQLAKYIKLVTGAHEDLKSQETTEDVEFIDEMNRRIRLYTFGVDSQNIKKHKANSQQNNLVPQHQKNHERVVRQLKHTEEHLHFLLRKGEDQQEQQLRQAEQFINQSQRASKVLQTDYVIDQIRKLWVVKDGDAMIKLATEFKGYVRSEVNLLHPMQVNLEQFEQELQDNHSDISKEIVQGWATNPAYYVNEKTINNLELCAHSLDIEDEATFEKTMELVKEHLRSKISLVAATSAVVHQQFENCMTLEDQVNAGDISAAEDTMTAIAKDVFDNQKIVVINEKITEAGLGLLQNIRARHIVDAEKMTKNVIAIVYNEQFDKPSSGSLNHLKKSTEEQTDLHHAVNIVGLKYLLEETLTDVRSENFQSADQRIERLADRAQQVTKINKVQAVVKIIQNNEDADAMTPGIEELQKSSSLEAGNMEQDKKELDQAHEKLAALLETVNTESFNQSSKKLSEIINTANINVDAKWALMYAKKYADQNDPSICTRHLNHAQQFLKMDVLSVQKSLDSITRQSDLLDQALQLAEKADVHGSSSLLQQVIDEVNNNQSVCEVDENIENYAQDAKEALDEGDALKAARLVNEMTANLNDPYGMQRKENHTVPRIFQQDEQRKQQSYVDGHQGEDIRDVNLSVDQVDHAKDLSNVENLVNLINQNLEEMDINVKDKGWSTQPHKLEAERQLERLYRLAQLDYKVIDVRTILAKLHNVIEAQSDVSELADAIHELSDSNDEEQQRLENMDSKLSDLHKDLTSAEELVGDDEVSNQHAAQKVRELVQNEYAYNKIISALEDADKFLDVNKQIDANKRLHFAIEQVQKQQNEVQTSLQSLEQQNEAISEAGKQAKAGDAKSARDTLSALEKKVQAEQPIILTDDECTKAFNQIREHIYEGQVGDAAQAVQQLGEELANEMKAQKDFQHRAPEDGPSDEVQENNAEELKSNVLDAENSIDNGSETEAKADVEEVHETVQEDAKVKLIEATKSHVKEALEQGDKQGAHDAVETLKENLEEEKDHLEEEKEEVKKVHDQIEEASEQDSNDQEEATEEGEKLEEEVQEVQEVPAEVEKEIQEAQQAAEEGDVKEFKEKLEEAQELLDEEENTLKKSEDAVESQEQDVEAAEDAIEEGDEQGALKELNDVIQNVESEQPKVRVSESAQQKAEEAKEKIEDGESAEAVDAVEGIVSEASEDVDKEVGLEEGDRTELTEEDPFVSSLNALSDALQPEDPSTLDHEELQSLLDETIDAQGEDQEYDEQLQAIAQSLEAADYQTAIAQVEEILEALKPEEQIEEEEKAPLEEVKKKVAVKKVAKKSVKAMRKSKISEDKYVDPIEANIKNIKKDDSKKMRKSVKTAKKTIKKDNKVNKVSIVKKEKVSPVSKKSSFRK